MRLETARAPRRSAISLTPLIDVVFILLLFFMLTSRFQHYQAMALNVPASDSIATSEPDITPMTLELQSDGRVSINGALVMYQNALRTSPIVKEAISSNLAVHVSTSADVTLSTLTRLMDQLSAMGFSDVSLRDKP